MAVKVREKPKGSGVWWLFIDHAGKRKAKRVGTKRAAIAAAEKIQAKLALGDLTALEAPRAPVPTFGQYAERWIDGVAGVRCQASTIEQYRNRLKAHLLPHLKSLPLTAITRERIKALVAQEARAGRRRGNGKAEDEGEARRIAPATVRAFMFTLNAILNSALEDGLIQTNPAARWGRVVRQEQQEVEEIEVFTPSELTKLLEAAEADYPDEYPFLLCLARTGLRLGEALALQWADIDFRQRVILVRRSTRLGRTTVPKNGKARRVDMSRQLATVLQGWQSLRAAEATVDGKEASPWVFPTASGGVGDARTIRRMWAAVLKRAGLRYRKPHTLRHTYASLLIQAGEPITYVQQQLGHHSAAFTLAVYGHLIPRGDRRAVDALDDATGRNLYATNPTVSEGVTQA